MSMTKDDTLSLASLDAALAAFAALEYDKATLINGSAMRPIYDQLKWADMHIIQDPNVPPGKFYVVDKAQISPTRYRDMYDTKWEIDLKQDIADKNLDAKMKSWMQGTVNVMADKFDKQLIQAAMGALRANDRMDASAYTAMTNTMPPIPPNACDACSGSGVFNHEECWHCGGEGDDPTK